MSDTPSRENLTLMSIRYGLVIAGVIFVLCGAALTVQAGSAFAAIMFFAAGAASLALGIPRKKQVKVEDD